MGETLLFIGDESHFGSRWAWRLEQGGYAPWTTSKVTEGIMTLRILRPSVVLLELGSEEGLLQVLDSCAAVCPRIPVVVLAEAHDVSCAIAAFRRGAADVLTGGFDDEDVFAACRAASRRADAPKSPERMRRAVCLGDAARPLVAQSPAMKEVLSLVESVATTTCGVLITGETGTGKEIVARAIHRASKSRRGPFVPVSCGALPPDLLESLLFGHVKGAFTGAHSDRIGYFEEACGGTLFLDQVSEIPTELQAKLLRAIQEKEVAPVGGTSPRRVDARVVAASQRDLGAECARGSFREDLRYRLCVVEVPLPPLRERLEDLPLLIDLTLARLNRETGLFCRGVDEEAFRILENHAWPGNVRQLENVLERALVVGDGDRIRARDLPREVVEPPEPEPGGSGLAGVLRRYESEHIFRVLRETAGNREEAARRMGIDPSTLFRKIEALRRAGAETVRTCGSRGPAREDRASPSCDTASRG